MKNNTNIYIFFPKNTKLSCQNYWIELADIFNINVNFIYCESDTPKDYYLNNNLNYIETHSSYEKHFSNGLKLIYNNELNGLDKNIFKL
jgi:hypothetical protein